MRHPDDHAHHDDEDDRARLALERRDRVAEFSASSGRVLRPALRDKRLLLDELDPPAREAIIRVLGPEGPTPGCPECEQAMAAARELTADDVVAALERQHLRAYRRRQEAAARRARRRRALRYARDVVLLALAFAATAAALAVIFAPR